MVRRSADREDYDLPMRGRGGVEIPAQPSPEAAKLGIAVVVTLTPTATEVLHQFPLGGTERRCIFLSCHPAGKMTSFDHSREFLRSNAKQSRDLD